MKNKVELKILKKDLYHLSFIYVTFKGFKAFALKKQELFLL